MRDLKKEDAELMAMYPASNIKGDTLQIQRHLLDNHTTLVKAIETNIVFANLSKQAGYTRGKVFNCIIKIKRLADICYAGNETVGYPADKGIFYRKTHSGFEYGNWGMKIYEAWDAKPVISQE